MARSMAPAQFPLDQFFTYKLHRLSKLVDKGTDVAYAERIGLPVSQGRVLAAVGSFGPFSVGQLALYANLDKSQASRAADTLTKRGLIAKSPDESDARAVQLSLTRAGKAMFKSVQNLIKERNDEVLSMLSPGERESLLRSLDKMTRAMEGDDGSARRKA